MNRLTKETSPYLLQHAHNPVDWYPWGDEAFALARSQDKPVLVSIGYAACHWCHVMERESFENPEVAAIMNRHFINIKVDREERPDVDQIYMDAVQAISGSGGWPLNVFLTPDRRPFYGGTYFPPRRAFNRPSWTEVLRSLADAWQNRREEILQQAESLIHHLWASNNFGLPASPQPQENTLPDLASENLMKQADTTWGGFGTAPKFPQTFALNFLLRYASLKKQKPGVANTDADKSAQALEHALLSLNKMMQGGIYDHVGGGFARYATDSEWLVPHFEKMLYDNALLAITLADAYRFSRKEKYRAVLQETLEFIKRELMHANGGFYTALDADSEGEEGKFYVWKAAEVQELLGSDADIFCRYFDISEKGNWREGGNPGRNILWVKKPAETFAAENGISLQQLQELIARGKARLLQKRSERVRPLLDDKILLSWNALMNLAFAQAYGATGEESYKDTALQNMNFLLTAFGPMDALKHSWQQGEARHPGFLEDYAFLIAALIELGQVASRFDFFNTAAFLTETVLKQFSDEEELFFYFTAAGQGDLPVRKKELYDGATPSGNAVMAENLLKLAILLDKPQWAERGQALLGAMGHLPSKYPTSFGYWLCVLTDQVSGWMEIAVTGKDASDNLKQLLRLYLPNRLIMAAEAGLSSFPLLAGKGGGRENHIYLCRNYACRQPVFTVDDFVKLLDPQ